MNFSELKAELARNDLTIPQFANSLGICKKAMYDRFKGKVPFKQNEILKAKDLLHLSDEKIICIFFAS